MEVKTVLTVKLLDWPFGMVKLVIVEVPVVPVEITNEPTCVEPSHKVISDKSETVVEAVALVNLRPSLVRAISSLAAVKSIMPTVTRATRRSYGVSGRALGSISCYCQGTVLCQSYCLTG